MHPSDWSWIDGLHIPAWALILGGAIIYATKRLFKDFKGLGGKVGRLEKDNFNAHCRMDREINEMKQALVAHAYATGNKDILSFMAKYEAPKED